MPSDQNAEQRWIAIDVGCIECGESSALIGVYISKDLADAACAKYAEVDERDGDGYYGFFTNGQHHTRVFGWNGDLS